MPFIRSKLSLLATAAALSTVAVTSVACASDPVAATKVFTEAQTICERDAGALWGRSLCGPMMLVDYTDRSVLTNHPDGNGVLKAIGPIFTGVLPESVIIANTPTEWSGTRWTQLVLPLPNETAKRHVILAHELFHRIQPDLKLTRPETGNHHLDSLEGRYLLQLEWRALAKALAAPTSAARRAAIIDALLFRQERYRLFSQAAVEEGALEINEGVPEYTGVKLGLAKPHQRISFAIYDLSAFVEAPTFVRSFAYATGPAYGLLLDQADPAWRGKLGSGQRLDQLLSAALKLPPPLFASLGARTAQYDDGTLRAAEENREQERRVELAELEARLVTGPILSLPLRNSNYQFNPQTLKPLGEFGTVYPTMRLTDDWGALEVESGGALVNSDTRLAAVSSVGIDPSGMKGDGWHLTLNKGWTVKPGQRAGDLVVSRSDAGAR